MYIALIENAITTIYEDLGEENFRDNRIVGTLINERGIKEFLEYLPISDYYLDTAGIIQGKRTFTKLTKKQAFYMYNEIFKQFEIEKENDKKKIKSRY